MNKDAQKPLQGDDDFHALVLGQPDFITADVSYSPQVGHYLQSVSSEEVLSSLNMLPEFHEWLESILKEYSNDPRPIYVRDVIRGKTISVLPGKK